MTWWYKTIHKKQPDIDCNIHYHIFVVRVLYLIKKKKTICKNKNAKEWPFSHIQRTVCSTLNLGCTPNHYQQSSFLLSSLCSS